MSADFMTRALAQAEAARDRGEVPVGAVLVDSGNGRILAAAGNRCRELNDPTAHAEMVDVAVVEKMSLPDFDPSAEIVARPRWPLDKLAKPMLGSGKKGAKA